MTAVFYKKSIKLCATRINGSSGNPDPTVRNNNLEPPVTITTPLHPGQRPLVYGYRHFLAQTEWLYFRLRKKADGQQSLWFFRQAKTSGGDLIEFAAFVDALQTYDRCKACRV
jgi:hypothetical protein